MWIYIWLGVTALSLIVEALTSEMVSVWFAGGGLIALILAGCGLNWYIHLPVFIAVSLILMLCFRKIVMKFLNKGDNKTNAEASIGKEFILLSDIGFNSPGTVKIDGVVWNVVSENEKEEINAGEKVILLRLKGNKYIVKKS